jgi:hypothetical protein
MDPYLERYWRDVHTKLIAFASEQLNERLPDDLIASAEERMVISRDIRIFAVTEDLAAAEGAGGGVALAPYRLSTINEPAVERLIEIIDVNGGERVVTVIEFVSPTNKGDGLGAFVDKRKELLKGGVNFVEIDLIRQGDWRRLLGQRCPTGAEATYRAVFRVPGIPPSGFMHPFPLREALPAIKIPLRKRETPCELELQPLVDHAYRSGRYGRTIDYRKPCEPPIGADDAGWVEELLSAAGRR